MRLLFRQRVFSWFDSYDIYGEDGEAVFVVRGKMSWGHRLEISDCQGRYLGRVQEEVLTLLPRFAFYVGETYAGQLKKEFSLFSPRFTLDCQGWRVEGDWLEWDYRVTDSQGRLVMTASKELAWTDTYQIQVERLEDALLCLMIVLAIDAEKCSRN